MTRILRRLYWLRHRLLYWLDSQTTDALGMMALGAMLFLLGCMRYMDALKGW